jgi:hypothetical protein
MFGKKGDKKAVESLIAVEILLDTYQIMFNISLYHDIMIK